MSGFDALRELPLAEQLRALLLLTQLAVQAGDRKAGIYWSELYKVAREANVTGVSSAMLDFPSRALGEIVGTHNPQYRSEQPAWTALEAAVMLARGDGDHRLAARYHFEYHLGMMVEHVTQGRMDLLRQRLVAAHDLARTNLGDQYSDAVERFGNVLDSDASAEEKDSRLLALLRVGQVTRGFLISDELLDPSKSPDDAITDAVGRARFLDAAIAGQNAAGPHSETARGAADGQQAPAREPSRDSRASRDPELAKAVEAGARSAAEARRHLFGELGDSEYLVAYAKRLLETVPSQPPRSRWEEQIQSARRAAEVLRLQSMTSETIPVHPEDIQNLILLSTIAPDIGKWIATMQASEQLFARSRSDRPRQAGCLGAALAAVVGLSVAIAMSRRH